MFNFLITLEEREKGFKWMLIQLSKIDFRLSPLLGIKYLNCLFFSYFPCKILEHGYKFQLERKNWAAKW